MSPPNFGLKQVLGVRLVCPRCPSRLGHNNSYHGAEMLAARLRRNILDSVVRRMPQYKTINDIPEHLF